MKAALWVVQHCDPDTAPHLQAAELLLDHHARTEKLSQTYSNLSGFHPIYEQLLRIGATSSVSPQGRALATFELAELLVLRANFRAVMEVTPELDNERRKNMGEQVVEYLNQTNRAQDQDEAERLYRLVKHKYANVPYRDQTLGSVAAERLAPFEQAYPEIGKTAPETVGKDLNGSRLTLTEFREKVVVISFWASWCSPCLERLPEENQLVEEFRDANFVLLGLNGDLDLEEARQAVQEHSIQFRSWWDNPEVESTLVEAWGVTEWPTAFVVDQSGIIRYKNISGPDLRTAVLQLLKERDPGSLDGQL